MGVGNPMLFRLSVNGARLALRVERKILAEMKTHRCERTTYEIVTEPCEFLRTTTN